MKQVWIPLFDIYMKNKERNRDKKLQQRFKKIIGRNEVLIAIQTVGRESQIKIRETMLKYMNVGHSKNKFI